MEVRKVTTWSIEVVAAQGEEATVVDIDLLLDGLGEFAKIAAGKFNALDETPSEVQLSGPVALHIDGDTSALRFGEQSSAIAVAFKWQASTEWSSVHITPPAIGRRTPPDAPGSLDQYR